MRIAVTGATGNVGTALLRVLAADPDVTELVGIARRAPGTELPLTRFVAADIAGDDLTDVLCGMDALIHLAWRIQPARDPLLTWATNAVGTRRLLAAAVAAGVRTVVHASSVGAYSPVDHDEPVDETWATDGWPTAGYTREKAYCERVLDALEAEQPWMRVVRLRPAFVFQRAAAVEQRRLFAGPLVPGRLVAPRTIPVVPDLPGLRFQAVHADDLAEAYRLVVLSDVRGAFNVAADGVLRLPDVADLLDARTVRMPPRLARAALQIGFPLHLVPSPPALFDAFLRLPVLDAGRAQQELGWRPAQTARQAIATLLTGLHEGEGGPTPPLDPATSGPLRWRELTDRL